MLRLTHDAGCPADQVQNFLRCGYVPQPKQVRFHAAARECDRSDGPTEVGYGGVRGEAKTHAAFAQVALDDCQRTPGMKFLYLRKIGKAVRESFSDLRRRVLSQVPHEYIMQRGVVEFPQTGSMIVLGHFKTETDIDSYLGLEYDGILIEEATQLSERKHRDIKTCRRTSKIDWRPRTYYTFNPGGVGHAYIKRLFYDPLVKHTETSTRFIRAERGDNVFIDPDYRKSLDELTGWQRDAWRDGKMDIAAGQFFTTFNRDVHVRPWQPPVNDWAVWLSMDYGFTHWQTVYLMALSGDGHLYIADEHCARGWLPERHAGAIEAMLNRNHVAPERVRREIYAGGDVFAKKQDGKTIADDYKLLGWKLRPANTSRTDGAAEFLARFGDAGAGIAARITISERCPRLIECLPSLVHDPNQPEDVLKIDTDDDGSGGDDPYDGARYGVMVAARRRNVIEVV